MCTNSINPSSGSQKFNNNIRTSMQQSATVPEYDLLDVLQKSCVPTGLVVGGGVSGRGTQDQTPLAD